MTYGSFFGTFFVVLVLQNVFISSQSDPKVIFIVCDGMRWDYVQKTPFYTVNFNKIKRKGVQTNGLIPVYPALTYPNMFSFFTGVYPQTHGYVSNSFYDPTTQTTVLLGNPTSFAASTAWIQSELFMTTAAKGGKVTAMFPSNPIYAYNIPKTANDAARAIVNGDADVVFAYFAYPDLATHYTGADGLSPVGNVLAVDTALGLLMSRLGDKLDDVNIIVVGDHGMTNTPESKAIDVNACLGSLVSDLLILDMNIYVTNTTSHDAIYIALTGCHQKMTVYKKADVPSELHYTNNSRIGDFVMLFDRGYFIKPPIGSPRYKARHNAVPSEPDMQSLFYAQGPHFWCGHRENQKIKNVDMYGLVCRIMGLTPASNEGSISVVDKLLVSADKIGKPCGQRKKKQQKKNNGPCRGKFWGKRN